MATLHPFRALRPHPDQAARVAAVPYDVVSADEARALASGNALSFLHVSRAEIDLPPGTDAYADAVYERAAENFETLKRTALILEEQPTLYFYRLRVGDHEQTGVAGCYSLDEYDHGIIKKHERTRRDKEDDRTRHMLALGAQTGPVFLTYRASPEVDQLETRVTAGRSALRLLGARRSRAHAVARRRQRSRRACGRIPPRSGAVYRGRPSSRRERRARAG